MERSDADRRRGAGTLQSADEGTSTGEPLATPAPCAEQAVLGRSEPPPGRSELPPARYEAVPGGSEPMAGCSAPTSRREEILDGATEMFADHGFYGSSLRSRSALYEKRSSTASLTGSGRTSGRRRSSTSGGPRG